MTTPALNVSITQNYRLITDETDRSQATQFILQRRHIVDPTKAPGYKAPADGSIPPVRETWKDGGYYPLSEAGINLAAKGAILRDTDVSQAQTIGEALRIYADATDKLTEVITECLRLPVA